MSSNNQNGKGVLKGGGIGGGNLQIPVTAALRKPVGRKFRPPVDRAAVKAEIDVRILDTKENIDALHKIGTWLAEIDQASPDERDQYAAEIRQYAGDLDDATKDLNPAIRRVGTYELLRWKFGSHFITWEQVGIIAEELASRGVLVVETNPEKFIFRCGQTGYTVETGLGLEPAQLAEVKNWFTRIAGDIRTHTCREWEGLIGMMRKRSVITLEQLVEGEPGPCYIVVPDDLTHKGKDNRPQPLEGGHLLVECVDGKIFVIEVAGDPVTGKGFAFVRRMEAVMALRPKAFLPSYKLCFWSPFRKRRPEDEMKEVEKRAQVFFDSNPEHAKACTVVHASIKRTIVAAFNRGKFDNSKAQVKYLNDRRGEEQGNDKPQLEQKAVEVLDESIVSKLEAMGQGAEVDNKKSAKKPGRKPSKKDDTPATV